MAYPPDVKKGALHRQLGIPPGEHIPRGILREVMRADNGDRIDGHTVTPLMKKRANFALNFNKR
jgi:hypothetical protein